MGSFTGALCLFSVKNKANDMLPILPQYISKISIYFDATVISLVIPVEIPTVPMAENISIRISDNGSVSNPAMISVQTAASIKFIKNTVEAFLMESSSIRLPNIFSPLLLRYVAQI